MTAAQTLRRMAGATAPTRVDPAHTALVLIDFQKEYYNGALPLPEGEAAVENAARLVDWADRVGIHVVHVHHVAPSAKAPLFTPETERVAPHEKLAPKPGHQRITKTLPSSFVNTVAGLMTHMCVDSTARDAVSLGYKTIVAGDACATRDLPDRGTGAAIPHREIHRASLTALADRFADVLSSAEIRRLA